MRAIVILLCVGALVGCGGTPPTATPAFPRYTVERVIATLTPLGASDFHPTPRSPQDQSPNTATAQRDFAIPAIAPKGGQLLLFDSAADVAGMQTWYARFPDLAPYVFVKGNALLQLNSTLPKAEAERYRRALEALP